MSLHVLDPGPLALVQDRGRPGSAAIGVGPGAETRAPMARAIIGGIVLSTLVTLVLVPVFYVLVERIRASSGKLLAAPEGADDHAPTHGQPELAATAFRPAPGEGQR